MDKSKLFVIWLNGFLEASEPELNISKTNAIRNRLNDLFEHVAEPVVEKVSLQDLGYTHGFEIHNGFPSSNGIDEEGTYRC